jgi:hypothetical protein
MAADFDSTGLGAENAKPSFKPAPVAETISLCVSISVVFRPKKVKKVSVPAILENRRIDTLSDNWLLCVELPSTIVPQPNP